MNKVISNFDDIEWKKSTFYKSKYPIDKNEVDIDKIVISEKVLFDKKRF